MGCSPWQTHRVGPVCARAKSKARRGKVLRGPAVTSIIPFLLHPTGPLLNPAAFSVGPALAVFS